MKSFDSHPLDTAMCRLVLARVIVGIVVVAAVILAPPVMDSIATLDASGLLEEAMNGELVAVKALTCIRRQPRRWTLSMSY